jgi:hypothetical protein
VPPARVHSLSQPAQPVAGARSGQQRLVLARVVLDLGEELGGLGPHTHRHSRAGRVAQCVGETLLHDSVGGLGELRGQPLTLPLELFDTLSEGRMSYCVRGPCRFERCTELFEAVAPSRITLTNARVVATSVAGFATAEVAMRARISRAAHQVRSRHDLIGRSAPESAEDTSLARHRAARHACETTGRAA